MFDKAFFVKVKIVRIVISYVEVHGFQDCELRWQHLPAAISHECGHC